MQPRKILLSSSRPNTCIYKTSAELSNECPAYSTFISYWRRIQHIMDGDDTGVMDVKEYTFLLTNMQEMASAVGWILEFNWIDTGPHHRATLVYDLFVMETVEDMNKRLNQARENKRQRLIDESEMLKKKLELISRELDDITVNNK
jgi:hypothetical protein